MISFDEIGWNCGLSNRFVLRSIITGGFMVFDNFFFHSVSIVLGILGFGGSVSSVILYVGLI